jgi:hypothetical protein
MIHLFEDDELFPGFIGIGSRGGNSLDHECFANNRHPLFGKTSSQLSMWEMAARLSAP